MLHVQHLVVEHVGDDIVRHLRTVEQAVDEYRIQGGIEAAQLRAPGPLAPSKPGWTERAMKVATIEFGEKRRQVVALTIAKWPAAGAFAAESGDSPASSGGAGEFAVAREEIAGRLAAVKPGQKNRRHSFEDIEWRAQERIGKLYMGHIFPQANCVRKRGVGMEPHFKAGRPAI
jgi:hypothetical protein